MIERFANHPVASNIAMILAVIAGVWSIHIMPTQLDPPTSIPQIEITVTWIGAAAEDVELSVTTPIEQAIHQIQGIDQITSKSRNGLAEISIDFRHGADLAEALDNVKQMVANIRNLPAGIEPPEVRRVLNLQPVATVLVTTTGELTDLLPVVRVMEQELVSRGIDAILFEGLPKEEIALMVSGSRLTELKLTLIELAEEIAATSQNLPGGKIGRGQRQRLLRSSGLRTDVAGYEAIRIRAGNDVVRLGDIASIQRRIQEDESTFSRRDHYAVEIHLWRSARADAQFAHEVLDGWFADKKKELPAGITLTVYDDLWEVIDSQFSTILFSGVVGLALVLFTLYLFLNTQLAIWVMIGIPVSVLGGIALFHGVFDQGISIVAFIAFIMAVGIIVDDAIVVGEDIDTLNNSGCSPSSSCVMGAKRMWTPVATSSLTTLAAFIPLLLVGGAIGELILTLPMALLCIIVASLVECFLILPGHLRSSLEARTFAPSRLQMRFRSAFNQFRSKTFEPIVKKAIDNPGFTLSLAALSFLCALSLVISQHVRINLVIGFDVEAIHANVEFSENADATDRIRFKKHLEKTLQDTSSEIGAENIRGWVAKDKVAEFRGEIESGEQYLSIDAQFAFEEIRTVSPNQFATEWRKKIAVPYFVKNLDVRVKGGLNNGLADMTLVLQGADLSQLQRGAAELSAALERYPGVSNVYTDAPYGKDRLLFDVTPSGKNLGLTPGDVSNQLLAGYSGSRVQIINESLSELEVRAILPDSERHSITALSQFPIRLPSGEFVSLSSVATLKENRGIDTIRHHDLRKSITVFADVESGTNDPMTVLAGIKENHLPGILQRHQLSYGLGGSSRRDEQILEVMKLGGALTLVLIYLMLAWVFSSYIWPLAIMIAIPFSLVGSVFGHFLFGIEIGTMSLLAFFTLSGIIVNDSIILMAFVKRSLATGETLKASLQQGVSARFRAVVLTSVTTMVGLIPLLFDNSTLSLYVVPIAVTLTFGLAVGSVLVLLVIPALILFLESLALRLSTSFTSAAR